MDTCRPVPDQEAGDADLSLLSYLDCCENSFLEYQRRVEGADYQSTFEYLVFHTPFGGMVKGAHRKNMRRFKHARPEIIDADFDKRVAPSLVYCQRVGNLMGATTHLALASLIDNGDFDRRKRIGIFSYGSGCCSEFYSGIAGPQAKEKIRQFDLAGHLDDRCEFSMEEYERTFDVNSRLKFGTKNYKVDRSEFPAPFRRITGKNRLVFSEIKEFHRKYEWV
jgi:polyketide biosynthesis 3-hydroxy-3-methylglutaryl-CoA synthase-like enzyme PksG